MLRSSMAAARGAFIDRLPIICAKPPQREAFTPDPQRHAALLPRLEAYREIYRCRPERIADIKQATH